MRLGLLRVIKMISDDKEYSNYLKLDENTLSVSPQIPNKTIVDGKEVENPVRAVSMKFGNSADHKIDKKFETKEGLEIHLKTTETGHQEIKAYFYEDTRNIQTLTIQRWMIKTGNPHKEYMVLYGKQLELILDFVNSLKGIPLHGKGRVTIPVNIALQKIKKSISLDEKSVRRFLKKNPSLIKSIVENEIDESDVISLGYRKKQLKLFKEMLSHDNLKESDWQQFFEKNNWIFGYGLSYIFHNGLDEKKLEQVVSGFDVNNSGKRVDALLKTAGFINSLCFVEIKTHKTELLQNKSYRAGCWAVSNELLGGVTQIQNTVSLNLKNLYGKTQIKDKKSGDLTGEEFFNFQPKSFLIIGSLSQLIGNSFPNEDKFRSFELFRKNTLNPEIITFDELYERARFIIDSKGSNYG